MSPAAISAMPRMMSRMPPIMSMMAAKTVTPVAHSRSGMRALSGCVVVMPATSFPCRPPVANVVPFSACTRRDASGLTRAG
ncbi:hypothetical protein C1J00_35575 [Streptomyces cahuitamycinicus]|uniref:Uncharacterized protein n=1 Tax=Streptomyces cahuitamycinicus TaxID=2070367 RepID=A0A2N8TF04_9ACTN|nr:hypothetical protein C1J00_35575 [Streptomyces cahuitamycinicus]